MPPRSWRPSTASEAWPGATADCCLILEGPQGLKKSTALKTIAGEWFTDEIAELGSKDAALQTRGVWVIEIAELDSMSRADVSKIKAFMSRTCDRFRPCRWPLRNRAQPGILADFSQVGISEGCFNPLVPQEFLDSLERRRVHDQPTGKRMPQIMPAEIGNPRCLPAFIESFLPVVNRRALSAGAD